MTDLSPALSAIGIEDIAIALPTVAAGNDAIIDAHGFDRAFIERKLGIENRWRLSDDDTVSAMAARAVDALFETVETPRDAVEMLIVVTQTPDYCLPGVATLVQHAAGLPTTIAAFDLGLGCSGYVYGLSVARAMMAAEGFTTGVLVTAEAYSRVLDEEDRATAPLFGDAATATLLSTNPRYRLGRGVYGSDGSGAQSLIVHGSGSTKEPRQPLHMNGRDIFNFMMTEAPANIAQLLEREGLTFDDIDACVFHQASQFMLKNLARSLKLPDEKLIVELADIGNTTSSTIPIALKRQLLDAATRPDRVLISGFGVGLSWASMMLKAT